MILTDAQRIAINTHDRNLIVVAGAGSGKTRVLVERYLALLDAPDDWPLRALVAVTFTRKAAQEMRARVRVSLQARLQNAESLARAQRWSDLLAHMDSARIDTIHGLCATILRANAASAGIDPGFVVLDEIEARLLLENVVDDVLSNLVQTDDPALELFAEYEERIIRATLTDSALLAAEIDPLPDDLFTRWTAIWMENAAGEIERLIDDIRDACWQPAGEDVLSQGWRTCIDVFDRVQDSLGIVDKYELLQAITAIRMPGRPAQIWGEDGEVSKAALAAVKERVKLALTLIGDPPGETDQRAADLLPLWESVIVQVKGAFQQAKRDQHTLDFDDLERMTRHLLDTHQEVRERYRGGEFKHLLVDEFQDTNSTQWAIIQSLADLNRSGSLFVVGDPKQSIYAFRGAEVSVFGAVQSQIEAAGGGVVALSRSFRTHQPLVSAFNHIFSQILVRDAGSPVQAYEVNLGEAMEAQRQSPPAESPNLEFLLIDKDLKEERERKLRADDFRRLEANQIAHRLHTMIQEKTPIFDRESGEIRPVQYDDVAILFQSTSSITLYEDMFKAAGLPFVTIAGRGYYSRQEVWDLLNLLRALHNPADDLSLATALRSPLFSLSDDALLALRLRKDEDGRQMDLWAALDDGHEVVPEDEQGIIAFARDCLYRLRRLSGRVTISELLREVLEGTGYLAILTGLPDGARRRGNVEKLVSMAQTRGKVTLGAFSAYLHDLSAREVREGESLLETTGAVTLMTVHASKGLEFPVIVLADASWERGRGNAGVLMIDAPSGSLSCKVKDRENDGLATPYAYRHAETLQRLREKAERKRLLYVAATRAQDYLLVSGQVSTKNATWQAKGWLGWLLDSLGLDTIDENGRSYPWGDVRVSLIEAAASEEFSPVESREGNIAWYSDPVRQGQPFAGPTIEPELIGSVPPLPDDEVRHFRATHIADVGSANHASRDDRNYYRNRFRRSVLHDAPETIPLVSNWRKPVVSRRQIGDIVHELLRHWRFPTADDDLEDFLQSYAWERGIADRSARQEAVREARQLLAKMVKSDIFRWVTEAKTANRPVYHELPFVFRQKQRIIHGVIDVLLQRDDGTWMLVDYKTSRVGHSPDTDAIRDHARRYHLQLGVYADAVCEYLGGIIPETFIHYIRYSQTVEVSTAAWQRELEQIDGRIDSLLRDETE